MATIGLTDRPIDKKTDEVLGISEYVDALAKFVSECQTPITISIQGDWGTGKTSMMNLIKENLEKEHKNVLSIWFNTWQFSQFNMQSHLSLSLLSYFIEALDTQNTSVAKTLGKLGKGFLRVATTLIAEKTLGEVNASALSGQENAIDIAREIVNLKKELESLVHSKLSKDGKERLVVFVDDLDRLQPEKAIELLEVMKLFLDVNKCIFLLAVDYNVVVQGIKKKYEGMDDAKGKSFFDKIIQLPFNLPVSQYRTDKYFSEMLKSGGIIYSENDLALYVRVASLSVGFNPRSMKRLFNSYQLLKMVAQTKKILEKDQIASLEEKHRILFCILCMQTGFDKLYRYIQKSGVEINDDLFSKFRNLRANIDLINPEDKKELDFKDETSINKVMKFFEALYEAIQLDSDKSENSNERLNENEIINFKSLLSFSSIIGNNDVAITNTSGNLAKYNIAANEIATAFNASYKEYFEKLNFQFLKTADDNAFYISGHIQIGAFAGSLVGAFRKDNSGVQFDDTSPTPSSYVNQGKYVVGNWFQKYLKSDFSNLQINNRRTYGYLILSENSHGEGASRLGEDQLILNFKNSFAKTLDILLPKLVQFRESKIEILNRINEFTDLVCASLKQDFLENEGWLVENGAKNLGVGSSILVGHKSWENGIQLQLWPASPGFTNLAFCVKRKSWGVKYDQVSEERIVKEFDSLYGQGCWVDGGCIRAKNLDKARFPVIGKFEENDSKFGFDTEEKKMDAIKEIVDAFKKAKNVLKPIIDSTKLA
ncbi:MAG: hypothetical protein HQM08_23985 [Candidatus Riflebacteria bacterium]|nr:hypothetical protein [Candidatus Riflebacteria bacterium]